MKIQSVKSMIAAGLLTLTAAAMAPAQSANSLLVNVPFAFTVGVTKLPAGAYSVQEASDNGLILIQSKNPGQSVAVLTRIGGNYLGNDESGLVFERNAEGEAVLTKVQMVGEPDRIVGVHTAAAKTTLVSAK
ncbi:MAG: hypothetical protein WBW33_27240 [Bryobacteraceae bacterium]